MLESFSSSSIVDFFAKFCSLISALATLETESQEEGDDHEEDLWGGWGVEAVERPMKRGTLRVICTARKYIKKKKNQK